MDFSRTDEMPYRKKCYHDTDAIYVPMARKPEKLQENQTPIRNFFSLNITNSNIVVTNMATFQCNYSVRCIRRKPIN